jgi:hypothetical protein
LDAAVTIGLVFAAGLVTALVLGWIAPALGNGLKGALALGGLGGLVIGLLKDHITGAHHHMAGLDMPGMSMAPATDPAVMLSNLLWGAAGGAVFVVLAYGIGKIVPDKGGR